MPTSTLDRNRGRIDEALVSLLNTANPVLKKITRYKYKQTNDPSQMLKFCHQNWDLIRPQLQPFGITINLILSARDSRNKGAHRNTQITQSSKAHYQIADIYKLQEGFQKAQKAMRQPQRPRTGNPPPGNSRNQTRNPRHGNQRHQSRPDQDRRGNMHDYECVSCGHRFQSKPKRHSNSIAGMIAKGEGGYSVFCPRCDTEMEFDRMGNPGLFQEIRKFLPF